MSRNGGTEMTYIELLIRDFASQVKKGVITRAYAIRYLRSRGASDVQLLNAF